MTATLLPPPKYTDSTAFSSPPAYITSINDDTNFITSFTDEIYNKQWDKWDIWLHELYVNPSKVEDDLLTAPTQSVIKLAIDILQQLKVNNVSSPPSSVILNPNGGIVIEKRNGNQAINITIYEDLRVDCDRYKDNHLVESNIIKQPL